MIDWFVYGFMVYIDIVSISRSICLYVYRLCLSIYVYFCVCFYVYFYSYFYFYFNVYEDLGLRRPPINWRRSQAPLGALGVPLPLACRACRACHAPLRNGQAPQEEEEEEEEEERRIIIRRRRRRRRTRRIRSWSTRSKTTPATLCLLTLFAVLSSESLLPPSKLLRAHLFCCC